MNCKHKYSTVNRICKKSVYKDGLCKIHYNIPVNNVSNQNEATSSNQLINLNDTYTTFKYNNLDILCIKINEFDIWFKAKEAAEGLCYKSTDKAIRDHVSNEDKITLENIIKLGPPKLGGLENLSHNEKNSIFINEAGLYNLIFSSKKDEAKSFTYFVTHTILPSIRKTGNYISNKSTISSIDIKQKSFYSENMLIDYDKKNVVYIGCFIFNGKLYYKFGLSNDVYRRDYKEHKKTFEDFEMIFVMECDNNDNVELAFKKEMNVKKVLISIDLNDKKQIEIINPTENFTIDNVLDYLKYLVENMPLDAIVKKDIKIRELEDKLKNNTELEKYKIDKEINIEKYKIEKQYEYELEKYKLELMYKKNHTIEENNNLVNEKEESDSDGEYIVSKKEMHKMREHNLDVANEYIKEIKKIRNEKRILEEKCKQAGLTI